ncbi:MAG: hypothetical protein Q4D61_08095 [Cardiobacteriaceae bacterium]|nr:hypothetical protein [Cardiobacteriaceae bacterium]
MDTALPYAVYALHGADVSAFLQGQLTCDMRDVDAGAWRFAAYCTAQGKVLATLALAFDGEQYWLALPADLAEKTVARLRMFVLRSDVRFEARGERLYAVTAAAQAQGVRREDGAVVLDGLPGMALHICAVAPQATLAPAAFAAARIAAGIAEITAATADQFLPQMLDLPAIGALSFTKGCYVGQEAVARLQYKSVNRRLLATAHAGDVALPAPGAALLANDLRAGTVLSAALVAGQSHVQAVLQDRFLGQPLHVADSPAVFVFHPAHPEIR